MEDEVEIPIQRCLYRQSSLETRLSAASLSEDEDSDNSDEEEMNGAKIVGVVPKSADELIRVMPEIEDTEPSRVLMNTRADFIRALESKLFKTQPDLKLRPVDRSSSSDYNATDSHQSTSLARNEINAQYKEKRKSSGKEVENVGYEKGLSERNNHKENLRKKSLENVLERKIREGTLDNEESKFFTSIKTSGSEKMATLRPKSPRPTPPRNEKEESIWDKLGTLGRKKRIKEVQEVEAEGKYAIDSPGSPTTPDISPEDYELEENEERSIIQPAAMQDPKFKELQQVLIDWINDELSKQRIIVQDLAEDLYDGQVLQKLLEILTGDKLDVPEVTQSEEAQKLKLGAVLAHFNKVLGFQRVGTKKWNVQAIHSKNIVPIMHLLVALARHFRPPVRLTEHVVVPMVVVTKTGGQLVHRIVQEVITSAYDDVGMRCERDAFDTLFDHAPDKLQVVKKSMVTFVNKHLNKINLEVSEIETQFHDGVYLSLLMGLLEGFFVPLYSFHLTPKNHEEKVHNVAFAFELMEEMGIAKPKARPEDLVNYDLKSTLRVLYNLFTRYKNIS